MSETEDKEPRGGRASLVAFAAAAHPNQATPPISFDRKELNEILELYGRKVASGEWRDYAIDLLSEQAVFSVFRRTSETPLFRIVKDPALARRQGCWSVVSATGLVLKRGHELARVLGLFDKGLRLVEA